ncbi:MAG: ABC transporter permease [Candidatus Omnitrophica bacterium]|nr:ABC transporter permease [Candidatus Omnitrophota bacterium]
MFKYIVKRLFLIPPMLMGISLIALLAMHLTPGDPASMRYGLNPEVSGSARAHLKELYGLDKPVIVQYGGWLKRIVTLDFGDSFIDDRPVIEKIKERLPATLILQISALILIFSIALPIGVMSAVKQNSFFDKATTFLVFVGFATPTFWLALLLMRFFGFQLEWLPISGMSPWYAQDYSLPHRILDLLWHLILPLFTLAFTGLAGISRYTRYSMLEVIRQDYIRTARAKGLKENKIIYHHALKNALLPVITILGLTLPALIGGSFIFETIFAWPGMGRLMYTAILQYDYPVVMGVGIISVFLTLTGILISDILYAVVDPRIRYE